MVRIMVEYSVLFATKMTAKNVKDLERKAEATEIKLSKCLKKTVVAYQYGVLKKKDQVVLTDVVEDDKVPDKE